MIIKEFTIDNFKCFTKPRTLKFERGFNVVVGKNNAGKSALVQALSMKGESAPHISERTIAVRGAQVFPNTRTQIKYEVTRDEFRKTLLTPGQEVRFPTVALHSGLTYDDACHQLFERSAWEFNYINERNGRAPINSLVEFDVYRELPASKEVAFVVNVMSNGEPKASENLDLSHSSIPSFETFFGAKLEESIYAFRAERVNSHDKRANSSAVLEPDASNLSDVLLHLKPNSVLSERFNQAVHSVLPHIQAVTLAYNPPDPPPIMVYHSGIPLDREDLAIPLSQSGTGISQVLAILYVVVTARDPRIIIIDEPNSFLHPEAVRSLIEVLKSNSQHQYILTTHSPAVIAACDPATLTIIEQENGVSNFKQVDARRREDQTEVLYAVGANLSDVFGSDNILWVEGQTEEKAFPLIIKYFDIAPSSILTILPVRGTSDFMKNQAKAISDIYQRLSRADSLLPKTINFLLDTEKLSDAEKTERKKEVPILHFLPRRMYENYLLHAEAIAFVANNTDKLIDKLIDASIVEEWLEANHREGKYYTKQTPRKADWHEDVDSAKLLTDMFTDLFSDEHDYKKTRDSVELTKWLLDHDEAALSEVALLLERILRPVNETLNQPT